MLALVLGIVFGTHTFHLTDTPTGSEWRLPYGELVRAPCLLRFAFSILQRSTVRRVQRCQGCHVAHSAALDMLRSACGVLLLQNRGRQPRKAPRSPVVTR